MVDSDMIQWFDIAAKSFSHRAPSVLKTTAYLKAGKFKLFNPDETRFKLN